MGDGKPPAALAEHVGSGTAERDNELEDERKDEKERVEQATGETGGIEEQDSTEEGKEEERRMLKKADEHVGPDMAEKDNTPGNEPKCKHEKVDQAAETKMDGNGEQDYMEEKKEEDRRMLRKANDESCAVVQACDRKFEIVEKEPENGQDLKHPRLDKGRDLIQPNPPHVTFTNLSCSVTLKDGKRKFILRDIDGAFFPRKLTALMGPSGSGSNGDILTPHAYNKEQHIEKCEEINLECDFSKIFPIAESTLMDILSGRKSTMTVTGQILYEGTKPTKRALRHSAGYVEQFDTLVKELTVRQMLHYTARLKLPSSLSLNEINNVVDDVISKLELSDSQNTLIGSSLRRGISGGQSKRTNIALALIGAPSVIFLDEPTTGLDAHMATEVILLLRKLARQGRTIVTVIHNPSAFVFGLFDDLVLLTRNGRLAFSGPLDNSFKQLNECFIKQGFSQPDNLTSSFSVIEWVVQMTSGHVFETDVGTLAEQARRARKHDFAEGFIKIGAKKRVHDQVVSLVQNLQLQSNTKHTFGDCRPFNNGMFHAVYIFTACRTWQKFSSVKYWARHVGDKAFFALLILSLYFGIGNEQDVQSIASTASLLYWVVAICGFSASSFVPILVNDRPVFYREHSDGLYTSLQYMTSLVFEQLVAKIVIAFVFSIVIFFGIQLQGNFFTFTFIFYLTTLCGVFLAMFFGSLMPSASGAAAALPVYVTFCMFFGGLFLVYEKIPIWWNWFSYTTFVRYAWTALMLNQFDNDKFKDDIHFEGENVLEFYGMTGDGIQSSLWGSVGMLIGLNAIFITLAGLVMANVRHSAR